MVTCWSAGLAQVIDLSDSLLLIRARASELNPIENELMLWWKVIFWVKVTIT